MLRNSKPIAHALLLIVVLLFVWCSPEASCATSKPIIGILTQELTANDPLLKAHPRNTETYLAASYVKFVESAGARVVPIWVGMDEKYYRTIMSYVNGILLPGGSASVDPKKGAYAKAGHLIYQIAKEMKDKRNQSFPLWGTCLGMELLVVAANNGTDSRVACDAHNISMPLNFIRKASNTRLFVGIDPELLKKVKTDPLTVNFHKLCIPRKGLEKFWKVITTNHDKKNAEFVSSIEAHDYPFYAVQFHPEKNTFEWYPSYNISHSVGAVEFQQFLANRFVSMARNNSGKFPSEEQLSKLLIYNYDAVFTGATGSVFEQTYFFPKIDAKRALERHLSLKL